MAIRDMACALMVVCMAAGCASGGGPGVGPGPARGPVPTLNDVPDQAGRDFTDFPLQGGHVEPGDIVAMNPNGSVGDAIIRRETFVEVLRRTAEGRDAEAVAIRNLGALPYTSVDRRSTLERTLTASAANDAERASLRAAVQRARRVEQRLHGGRVLGMRDGRYALLLALDAMSLAELRRLRDAFDLGGTPTLVTQVEMADSATLLVEWDHSVDSHARLRIPRILEASGQPQLSSDSATLRISTARPIATGYKAVAIPRDVLVRRIQEKQDSAQRADGPTAPPTHRVQAWNASFTGMQFFEFHGANDRIPRIDDRNYATWFSAASTREIGIELRFAMPPATGTDGVAISCHYIHEGDRWFRSAGARAQPERGWTQFQWTPGGTLEYRAGNDRVINEAYVPPQGRPRGYWPPGRYSVECRAEDAVLARGFFEVG